MSQSFNKTWQSHFYSLYNFLKLEKSLDKKAYKLDNYSTCQMLTPSAVFRHLFAKLSAIT